MSQVGAADPQARAVRHAEDVLADRHRLHRLARELKRKNKDKVAQDKAAQGQMAMVPDSAEPTMGPAKAAKKIVRAQDKDSVELNQATRDDRYTRLHIANTFDEMLRASTTHLAMLQYLGNRHSTGPNSPHVQRARGGYRDDKGIDKVRGLNENLARELMELHTLGVARNDGSAAYSQAGATAMAAVATGAGRTHGQCLAAQRRPAGAGDAGHGHRTRVLGPHGRLAAHAGRIRGLWPADVGADGRVGGGVPRCGHVGMGLEV